MTTVAKAKDVADSTPVRIAARVGLLSYGLTHLLIAWLVLQIAFGGGGQRANATGAFEQIAQNPVGRALLWVLVAGFVAVAFWRLQQVVWGFSYETDRATRLRKRAASGLRVVLFAGLAVLAGRTAAGGGGGGGSGGQRAAAGVLGLPGGQFLVGAAGVVVVVAGVIKAWSGWKKRFISDMNLPLHPRARRTAVLTGQVGFVGRGFATVLVGVLVVVAAIRFRPEEANGLDGALRTLAQQPFGPWLLVLVALGLTVYGVFCFFDARYHRV